MKQASVDKKKKQRPCHLCSGVVYGGQVCETLPPPRALRALWQASVPLVPEATEAVHVVGTGYDLSHCQAHKGENIDKPAGGAKPRPTQLKHHLMVLDTVHLVCPA